MLAPVYRRSALRLRLGTRCAVLLGLILCVGLGLAPMACAQHQVPADPRSLASIGGVPGFAPLVKRVMPAVVSVSVIEKPSTATDEGDVGGDRSQLPPSPSAPLEDFLRRFFEQQGQDGLPLRPHIRRIALGSGFIIDPAGFVVTNDHLVAGAQKITVVLQDGRRYTAKLVGHDAMTDLALLKIAAPEPLPFVTWGDSDLAEVGDWVLAVGNPFGLGGTVSFGIVSARGRDIRSGPYDDFLQIDASLNRGNSGGPTFNLDGEVIGINTAIYTPSGGSVGVGFATPSNRAKPIIEQLKERGRVERGWIGVQIQEVTPELAAGLGVPRTAGALVAEVTAGGPAAKAGMKQGDVILSFDGRAINETRKLPFIVAQTAPGRRVVVELWHGHKTVEVGLTVAPMPEEAKGERRQVRPSRSEPVRALGLRLLPLTDQLRAHLDLPKSSKGVVVAEVAEGSPFAELDILPGDVIQSIDEHPVTTPQQVTTMLQAARSGAAKSVLLLINRQGKNHFIVLSTQNQAGKS